VLSQYEECEECTLCNTRYTKQSHLNLTTVCRFNARPIGVLSVRSVVVGQLPRISNCGHTDVIYILYNCVCPETAVIMCRNVQCLLWQSRNGTIFRPTVIRVDSNDSYRVHDGCFRLVHCDNIACDSTSVSAMICATSDSS